MRPSDPGPERPLQLAYFVMLFVVLIILLVATVGHVVGMAETSAADVDDGTGQAAQHTSPVLESMTCFTCHSLETYAEGGGEAFPHDFHLDVLEIQGCHACHAFEQHRAVINRVSCAECH